MLFISNFIYRRKVISALLYAIFGMKVTIQYLNTIALGKSRSGLPFWGISEIERDFISCSSVLTVFLVECSSEKGVNLSLTFPVESQDHVLSGAFFCYYFIYIYTQHLQGG